MTDLGEFRIFHLFFSPFYSKRIKAISIPDYKESSLFTIFVSNTFFPAFLPESGEFVSLTVTSGDLQEKIKELLGGNDEIVLVNPHSTRIRDNYVSYGQVNRYSLPESLFELYSETINFLLSIDRPLFVYKKEAGGKKLVPISQSRHFHVTSQTRDGIEQFDSTYNVLLFKVTRNDFHHAVKRTRIGIGSRYFSLVSMSATALYQNGDESIFVPINIKMEFHIYRELAARGDGIYMGHLYTVYNVSVGEREKESVNILVQAIFFNYSAEAIIPFIVPTFKENGISLIGSVNLLNLNRTRSQLLRGNPEVTKSIRASKNWYQTTEIQNQLRFVCVSPAIILKLLKAYVLFPSQRDIIYTVLTSESLISAVSTFLNIEKSKPFFQGDYVEVELLDFIKRNFEN